MNQSILTKRGRLILPLIVAALLFIICFNMYGRGGVAIMLVMMFDPTTTIITIISARYARRILWVVVMTVFAALTGEIILSATSPTYDAGSVFMLRLAGQALVALIIRSWFRSTKSISRKQVKYAAILVLGVLGVGGGLALYGYISSPNSTVAQDIKKDNTQDYELKEWEKLRGNSVAFSAGSAESTAALIRQGAHDEGSLSLIGRSARTYLPTVGIEEEHMNAPVQYPVFSGKWCYGEDYITITEYPNTGDASNLIKTHPEWYGRQQDDATYHYRIIGFSIGPGNAPHTGEINFTAYPIGNVLYQFGDCSVVMVLTNDKLQVADNRGCSGINAPFTGIYQRCE